MLAILKDMANLFAIAVLLLSISCARKEGNAVPLPTAEPTAPVALATQPGPPPPTIPNLQAELLDDRNKTTTSALAGFDFKNFAYPLPRGWQNPDGSDLTLTNGRLEPIAVDTDLGMDPDEAAERKAQRRIGASYVTTKFLDVTGDGQDEAVVVLKIETTGSAIPQLVYIYELKDGTPELLWNFRTGDRADGGLKDIRVENGQLVIELYGQDRFLLGETETGKITDDEEQLCCPTYYTTSFYNWNGKNFLMKGKRQTRSIADPHAASIENMSEMIEKQKGVRK
jgi:hypothetical protein